MLGWHGFETIWILRDLTVPEGASEISRSFYIPIMPVSGFSKIVITFFNLISKPTDWWQDLGARCIGYGGVNGEAAHAFSWTGTFSIAPFWLFVPQDRRHASVKKWGLAEGTIHHRWYKPFFYSKNVPDGSHPLFLSLRDLWQKEEIRWLGTPSHSKIQIARNSKPQRNTISEIQIARNSKPQRNTNSSELQATSKYK